MYIKVTQSGGHSYIQLAESFRDDSGKPRQRVVSTLGRADETGGQVDFILNALLRAKGRSAEEPQIEFESALSLGDVWTLHRLWQEVGFDALDRVFRKARFTTAVEHAIRVMVFNRLCDPDSKLGVLRWLQTVSIPEVDTASITHQQLLRSMDALIEHQEAVEQVVAQQLRPMVDQDLSMVFYDLTTIGVEGHSELADDVRHYGMSKEGLVARQFMLGVVQTAEGLPIYHEVFDGNTAETKTILPTLRKVLARFTHIKRLIIVADRGLLSTDNVNEILKIQMEDDKKLEFILAVPARKYHDFVHILQAFQSKITDQERETMDEAQWQGHRLVVAHHPIRAQEQTQWRRSKIQELQQQAKDWTHKLDDQDAGVAQRGRKLSDSGAKAKLYHEVKEAKLGKIIKVDLQSELFAYQIDQQALKHAELADGKLLLVTNIHAQDMNAQEIVRRYKSLADIERGFRVLKSEIAIAPVYHRLPQRIRAHSMICFMALILYRVMRERLKMAKSHHSPESALAQLKRIHRHQIKVNNKALSGVTSISKEQTNLLGSLTQTKLTKKDQLNLL